MTDRPSVDLRVGELFQRIAKARLALQKDIRRAEELSAGAAESSYTEAYYAGVLHGMRKAIDLLEHLEKKFRKKTP